LHRASATDVRLTKNQKHTLEIVKKFLEKNEISKNKDRTETSKPTTAVTTKALSHEPFKVHSEKHAEKLIGYFLENQNNQAITQPEFIKKAKHRRLFRKLCKLKKQYETRPIGGLQSH
jgi:hypothetical protein